MQNETTRQFKVGQAVEFKSHDGTWRPAKVLSIRAYETFSVLVLTADDCAPFERRDNIVRPIQPAAEVIQYPPLRVMKNDHEPMQTWQQVLDSKPLAERQPHLYMRGYYVFVEANIVELASFLKNHRNSLVLDFNPPLDPDDESDFGTYRVFIITEGV